MRQAIVRPPSSSFALGLTTAGLGPPDLGLVLRQHEGYAAALERCGLKLLRLDPDPQHPDSCFVEDVAVLTERGFILTHPGAAERRGEVASMGDVLSRFQEDLPALRSPGTLDGGDVCEADGQFFIGLSDRTNREGAAQLAGWLERLGFSSTCVDLEGLDLLHLKSGLAYLGAGRLAVVEELFHHDAFQRYERVSVPRSESYAANCLCINDRILVASGHPVFEATLRDLEYDVFVLDVSEFQKMDGGLSCLSLRW